LASDAAHCCSDYSFECINSSIIQRLGHTKIGGRTIFGLDRRQTEETFYAQLSSAAVRFCCASVKRHRFALAHNISLHRSTALIVHCWHRGCAGTLNKQKPPEELSVRKHAMRASSVILESFRRLLAADC
jgi:hypothetical protein